MTKKGADLTTFGQGKKGADLTKKGANLTNSPSITCLHTCAGLCYELNAEGNSISKCRSETPWAGLESSAGQINFHQPSFLIQFSTVISFEFHNQFYLVNGVTIFL